ncbi:IS630 family transposase [Polaromonas sp. P1(28)-13]|nr:IS630 family transposase [Polaromonas sp. P1(28)-13]
MRQTELHLSQEDRLTIDEIRSKGSHQCREINRAHVLSCLDRGIPEAQIMAVLGVGRTAVWRTRAAYLQGGLELAVFDVARSGRPVQYDTDAEARVTALACSAPPEGRQRWTMIELERAARQEPGLGAVSRETVRRMLKKRSQALAQADVVHRGVDRGIPATDVQLARTVRTTTVSGRTSDLHRREEPAAHRQQPRAAAHGAARSSQAGLLKYTRNGTTNLFVAVEPKAGRRIVSVTERRGKVDFVAFIKELLTGAYAKARRVHLVLDNLNTHFKKCFDDVLGQRAATKLLRRVQFHYTPKHASWLNMAEIEIGILSRQCLDRRIASRQLLRSEVDAWQQARNALQRTIEWKFTRQDADIKLGRHYVSKLAC